MGWEIEGDQTKPNTHLCYTRGCQFFLLALLKLKHPTSPRLSTGGKVKHIGLPVLPQHCTGDTMMHCHTFISV